LTRVMVDLDFHPSGMIEKMASGMRFVKRAVEADLARFKAYVELGEAEGLEYSHETEAGGGRDQNEDKDEKDEKEEKDKRDEKNGNTGSRSQSSGNGSRSKSQSDDNGEKTRQERAERRVQRRA